VIGAGDDVFHSYGANQGYVLGDEASLVYDTGFHNRAASQILKRIRKNDSTIIVANSHYHSDHVFGNSVFAEKGAPIISHDKCSRAMRSKSEKMLDSYRNRDTRISRLLQGVQVAYPTITYRTNLTVHLGSDLNASILYAGTQAHTKGDSILHFPADGIVFAGDVLWVGYHPNLEDADIQGQIQALRLILRMKPRRIVPGHGPVASPKDVKRSVKYLEQLDRNIGSGIRKGLKGDDFVRYAIPRWSWGWKMQWLMESYLRQLFRKD
jgi:cyclase